MSSSTRSPALLHVLFALPCAGQAQILFSEDFESGASGWTAAGSPEVLWHVAEDGECGAVTRMAVYNRFPGACDYRTGGKNAGTFLSPVFVLDGQHSIVVMFDYRQDTDEGSPCVEIVDEARGKAATVIGCSCCADPYNSDEVARAIGALDNPALWAGKEVRLRLGFEADSDGNRGFGCMVDNIRVIASGPPEVLFREDFEDGAPAWSTTTEGQVPIEPPLWHIADAGECGAVTRMGAYNRGAAGCDYVPKYPSAGRLRSPLFTLRGAPPFQIVFDSLKDMDPRGDAAQLHLVDPAFGKSAGGGPYPNSAALQPLALSIDPAGFWSYWSGRQARLEFAVNAVGSRHVGPGWMVDNVRVTNSGSLPVLTSSDGRQVLLVEWPACGNRAPLALGVLSTDSTLALESRGALSAMPNGIALLGVRHARAAIPGPPSVQVVSVSIGE